VFKGNNQQNGNEQFQRTIKGIPVTINLNGKSQQRNVNKGTKCGTQNHPTKVHQGSTNGYGEWVQTN